MNATAAGVLQGDATIRRLVMGWLGLAHLALLLAGLFVVLIVASRTPGVQAYFPWQDFFHTAMVVHVDFSVLVWLLAGAGMLFSLNVHRRGLGAAWLALALAVLGTLIMAMGPFAGSAAGEAIMANYVPVLDGPVFLTGLVVFGLGVLVLVIHSLLYAAPVGARLDEAAAMRFGSHTAVVATVVSLGAFCWSWLALPREGPAADYYEMLFWGGGHLLQFAFVQLMMVAWLMLLRASHMQQPMPPRVLIALFLLGVLPVFAAPWIYLMHDPAGFTHRHLFTSLMIYGGGIAPVPVGLALLAGLWRYWGRALTPHARMLRAMLLFSVLLFAIGGVLGFLISGSNTIVPAHYHGSIIAVTMAFMGLSVELLRRMRCPLPQGRAMLAQPWIYGIGQIVHVIGLALAGGHGVARKTAGAEQGLQALPEIIAMSVMGIGGAVAVAGGALYLVLVGRALWNGWQLRRQHGQAPEMQSSLEH